MAEKKTFTIVTAAYFDGSNFIKRLSDQLKWDTANRSERELRMDVKLATFILDEQVKRHKETGSGNFGWFVSEYPMVLVDLWRIEECRGCELVKIDVEGWLLEQIPGLARDNLDAFKAKAREIDMARDYRNLKSYYGNNGEFRDGIRK